MYCGIANYVSVRFQSVFQQRNSLRCDSFFHVILTRKTPVSSTGFSLSHCVGCWPLSSTAAPNGSWNTLQRRIEWTWNLMWITSLQVMDTAIRCCDILSWSLCAMLKSNTVHLICVDLPQCFLPSNSLYLKSVSFLQLCFSKLNRLTRLRRFFLFFVLLP